MSGKTFEHGEVNQTLAVTLRNFILGLSALVMVVVAGIYLQPHIAGRLSESARGTDLAISPVEDAVRFSPEWYAWRQVENELTSADSALAISPVEEAERFTAEWYAWRQSNNETHVTTTGLALFPLEEAERYSAEHYAPVWIDDRLAISPMEEAERFTSEWYQWRMR